MKQIEKIKAEIKRLQERYPMAASTLRRLEIFINSLQAEPVSEDLEEAAKHYLYSNILYDDFYVGNPTDKDCIKMFKAGAKWMANQGETHESEVVSRYTSKGLLPAVSVLIDKSYKEGDKIIVQVRKKED